MQLLIIISSLIFVQAGVIQDEECDGILLDNVYHEKDVLKTDIDRAYLLAVDYVTNNLYFSYTTDVEADDSKTAKINLNNNEFKDIDLAGGFAQAVDSKTREVYIGTDHGIYIYDFNNDKIIDTTIDTNIWTVFFKDDLYFSVFPSQFLYVYADGEVTRFKDLQDTKVDSFIIDKDNVMYYTNATGLYSQVIGVGNNATLIKEIEGNGVRGMTLDVNNEVYLCFKDGIYKVKKSVMELEKVLDLEDAFGVAFDNSNNLIYSDAKELVRLKPSKNKTCNK